MIAALKFIQAQYCIFPPGASLTQIKVPLPRASIEGSPSDHRPHHKNQETNP